MTETTDEALVERMSRGDRAALGTLYERHAPRLRSVALSILRDAAEAEDVLHDVFIEAWRRKLRSEGDAASELGPQSSDPSADPVRILDHGRLHDLLATMSEGEKEVLVLGYLEGLSSGEIGERVGAPTLSKFV